MAKKQKKIVLKGEPQDHSDLDFSGFTPLNQLKEINKNMQGLILKFPDIAKSQNLDVFEIDEDYVSPDILMLHELREIKDSILAEKNIEYIGIILDARNQEIILRSDTELRHAFGSSQQYELVEYLAEHTRFVETKTILSETKNPYADPDSLSKAIRKINDNVMLQLELNKPLIQNVRKKGYRISPCYDITLTNQGF